MAYFPYTVPSHTSTLFWAQKISIFLSHIFSGTKQRIKNKYSARKTNTQINVNQSEKWESTKTIGSKADITKTN